MAEKKAFAWDSEVVVSVVEISEYEKREVRVCELKGKQYVNFTTVKKIKGEWKPVGGYSIPKADFAEIIETIRDLSDSSIKDAQEPKKTAKKSTKKAGAK